MQVKATRGYNPFEIFRDASIYTRDLRIDEAVISFCKRPSAGGMVVAFITNGNSETIWQGFKMFLRNSHADYVSDDDLFTLPQIEEVLREYPFQPDNRPNFFLVRSDTGVSAIEATLFKSKKWSIYFRGLDQEAGAGARFFTIRRNTLGPGIEEPENLPEEAKVNPCQLQNTMIKYLIAALVLSIIICLVEAISK